MKDIGTQEDPLTFIGDELRVDVFDGSDPAETGTRRWWFRPDLSVNDSDAVIRVNNNGDLVDVPVFEQSTSVEAGIDTRFGVVAPSLSEPAFIPLTDPADAAFSFNRVEAPDGTELSLHNRTAPGSAIPDSRVARWTFDSADTSGSTATDSWGSFDATINGATTGVSGEIGEAYDFDGNDDVYASDVVVNGIGSGAFSVSAWVNLDSTAVQGIFDFLDQSEDTVLYHYDSGGGPWHFSTDSGQSAEIEAGTATTGTWTHLVATAGGSNQTLYQDGSQIGSNSDAASLSYTGGIVFGQYAGSNYLDGQLDDLRVYDKALTSTEVSNLYNTGSISG